MVDWEVTEEEFSEEDFKLPQTKSTIFLKRIFDITLALVALIFFLPIGSLLALSIVLEDRGPILYAQKRVGKGGRFFYIFKFRSMICKADKHGDLGGMRGMDWRITKVGALMRNTALDELPNLLNILIGDMSFVGPRPERPGAHRKLSQAIPGFENRVQITPGLICVGALCNVDTETWIQEMKREIHYDMFYVHKYSLLFDIILITAGLRTTLFLKWGTQERKL